MEQKKFAIVRNTQNDDLYLWLGNNRWRNMRTLKEGEIEEEMARKIFRINLQATDMIFKNPNIAKLISVLGLKMKDE